MLVNEGVPSTGHLVWLQLLSSLRHKDVKLESLFFFPSCNTIRLSPKCHVYIKEIKLFLMDFVLVKGTGWLTWRLMD